VLIWVMIVSILILSAYVVVVVIDGSGWDAVMASIDIWWVIFNFWYWIITAVWLVPGIIIMPIYLNSIEYSVIAESGKTMPEIYVKKGIINITRKHVPFRTIVHVLSRAGPFDRLFGIGSVEIQTAGQSAQAGFSSAEEKIEGITFYEELRDFILRELRKFKDPYVTGTEVVLPEEDQIVPADGTLEVEILKVLQEIRDLLRKSSERK
jgi:membrane protein YdbS with pleckstrin-like domain